MSENRFIQGLNENQIQAVKSTEGYVRIIAGAGSGKTKVLVNRYAYIVEELGISPSNILCVTFTNRAAKEMRNRVQFLVSKGNVNDLICTYHGFCVKVLREDINKLNYPKTFTIFDTDDQKSTLREVYEELGINSRDLTFNTVLKSIHEFKTHNPYIEKYILPSNPIFSNTENNIIQKIILGYLRIQKKNYALDFDDLMCFTLYVFTNYIDILTKWQNRLNYIMVDETQDNNLIQWNLVSLLSSKYKNLFVVGDPDQSIYGWRGADSSYLVNFDKIFKPCKTIILNENYRSTPSILDVANSIIVNNKNRVKKDMFTKNQIGSKIIHFHGKTEIEEGNWVAQMIKNRQKNGARPNDFAILFRSSHVSRIYEQALIKENIPYIIYGGIRFFERQEIKDSLAYLRVIESADDLSFLRIINNPSRKLGKVFLTSLKEVSKVENLSLFETLKKNIDRPELNKVGSKNFIDLIESYRKKQNNISISSLLQNVLETSGLLKSIRLDGDQDRLDNIEELMSSIKLYEKDNSNEEDLSLNKYLQDIALYTNIDYKDDKDFVKLMTIHQAKGLEFNYVFLCGMSEGILPNYRALRERKAEALEEERRLAYVAVTRAEKELFITESEGFNNETIQKYPSRFIFEIKKNFLVLEGVISSDIENGVRMAIEKIDNEISGNTYDFKVGDMIEHQVFGVGKIIEIDENQKTSLIQFVNHEHAKPISFSYTGLKKIEDMSIKPKQSITGSEAVHSLLESIRRQFRPN